MHGRSDGVRAIALVGPTASGKTSLLESMLHLTATTNRLGSIATGTTVGDASPEARARQHSTEINIASFEFLGDRYAVVDCPGSVDYLADADHALAAVDLALIVVDPDPARALLAQPFLQAIEDARVPHAIFVNRIDQARGRIRELLAALEPMSHIPLVARQIPIWNGEHVDGFVDLALERAFVYRPGKPSERIDMPENIGTREAEMRWHMLEQLADHDDSLLEDLLNDVQPTPEHVFKDLRDELTAGQIAPLFFGSALNGWGVRRLLKALRHETPGWQTAAARIGATGASAYVMKVSHASQVGKLAIARQYGAALSDGAELTLPDGEKTRAGGLFAVQGGNVAKQASAAAGDIVAIAKVDEARPGDLLSADGKARSATISTPTRPALYTLAITTRDRKDDVRLSGALAKLVEEDPALSLIQDAAAHATLLGGASEEHLRLTLDRLKRRYGVAVDTQAPPVPYRETIRKPVTMRGRHKKQSGGHGQFGDVIIEVKPLERSSGFQFSEKISGGAVPKQWIPAVEAGVRDAMERGPLGFPVVDVAVTLIDGSYHSVDSSELAFRTAGRIAMSDALAQAAAYLLEPIVKVSVEAPQHATSKISASVSGRRGQILGFGPLDGWAGWDRLDCYLPQSEMQNLAAELRALSQGLARFTSEPAYMSEINGRLAEDVVKAAKAA